MKKLVSLLLALVMVCSLVPMTVYARNSYIVYEPTEDCQMTGISFTKENNPWLLWDVTFAEADGETVLKTEKNHPGLVGAEVVPSITFEGTSATFNGEPIVEGKTIKLKAENEIVVADTANHNFAEYTVIVTEESNGLPVVLLDTNGAKIETKVDYVDVKISILGADVYGAKNLYAAPGTSEDGAGIKLRGNSTMGYAKKPYRIKFDKKQDVLGLGKAKSWVLLADYLDPSSMRNQVAFNLANRINSNTAETTGFQVFSPRMKLVEVYLNGEYQGLYEMGDHMQANELRVAINELGDEEDKETKEKLYKDGELIGYFIEVEVQSRVLDEGEEGYEDWSDYSYITNVGSSSGKNQDPNKNDDVKEDALYFQFKLPEEPSAEHKKYITDLMQQVNDLILANDDAVWELVDMDSIIDWYIVNELFKNADSQMQSSIYFFKDGTLDEDGNEKENPNTKLYMGPVWDFDLGAGGVSYGKMDDPTGWRTKNDEYCGWFRELFEMDSFKTALEARWADLHEKEILEAVYDDMRNFESYASEAAIADFDLWHSTYVEEVNKTSWLTVPEISTDSVNWETHVDYFESYLKARIAWLDEQFGYAEETKLATKHENVDSLTYTAHYDGNSSQKYVVDLDVKLDELGYELDLTSTSKWNLKFNYTVTAKINGQTKTFTLTPSTMGDWQAPGGVFDGETNTPHAAGTYSDRKFDIAGALVWNLNNNQGASGVTKDNLSKYVTSLHFNYLTLEFNGAKVGNTATFSLKKQSDNSTVLSIEKTVLTGKPSIMGDAKAGMTLFASTTEILPFNASVTYQWYADGSKISGATGSSYKMTTNDIGKVITVKATGTDAFTGSVTSDPKTVVKNTRTSRFYSDDIQLEGVTANSITVSAAKDNVEFSIDGETWTKDGVFTGLDSNKVYSVYIRAAEHNTGAPGIMSDALYVTTLADETIKGDVNGSGEIQTKDAMWVLDQALEFATMTNETALYLSDMNDDGKINTLDARLILKEIVNNPEH